MTSTSLPKLPVPELQDTAARFVEAARPLFSAEEFETCLVKLNDFIETQGPTLQMRLKERSEQHENWLEEWWNEYAYFMNRASTCFNVNYFFGFRDTPQQMSQSRLAAALIESAVRFRNQLEAGSMKPDNIRGKPMCMHQYQYMFATCRHPGKERDWTEIYPRRESSHIAIAHQGHFYVLRLPALGENRNAAIAQIERQLQSIINTKQLPRTKSIGILTSTLRDDWYAARECLLQVSPTNAASLRLLESSAFLVSLESSAPVTHKEFSLACHCDNGMNRYFDKNFQLLVFANGRYGFNGEHSLTDATTDMRLCNVLVHDVEAAAKAPAPCANELPTASEQPYIELLEFEFNDELLEHIERAIAYFDATVNGHELATLVFDSFGKDQIKQMKVSPDAFVQMAMQLAYYRQFGHVPPTYESASTKSFARGRTETSRSVSVHSAAWCRAMVDHPETTSLHSKAELLRNSIAHQSQFTAQCARGSGIDRHLLGLEYALHSGESRHALFSDKVFTGSRHWKMSTSQISDPILAAYGWGEVVDDGFGIAYRIENNALHFNVVSQCLGSARLCQYLSDALMDMRFLLTNAHKQPHEIKAEVDAVANVLSSIKLLSSSSPRRPLSPQPATPAEPSPLSEERFRVPAAETAPVAHAMVDELDRLPSNEVICALEMRLSRFVKESLSWALPSAS
ncbi:Carnitine O-acetyltransferase mitochondrial [Coemansia sp. RSA 989]|nr:Carnitine O-acetyltransferase mitochondrial [Coemansia sp. RSA 1086]KAJ1749919.1 Carnitine O-acetyltransferase mitochondrial [Coemansia sp. RSA 1821]KAJ1860578.1 Carnitine O-acetyltransferase mitochondrial [Coemansia sp. RSA 989]KAJ1872126.1 Carnitine O-acetyltransferase mitochondrial [Coemansia sp. RSA 990]KAJ2633513.1 Carnitine O-acetyltransferase mitochondrial [Coemansia sp. RSA 1290]KAJ2650830.1 Carnitine O-acetyltransferase mitochondrial [Coemansia sp. RSA 1250]KAJ2669096.1 Carnitine 